MSYDYESFRLSVRPCRQNRESNPSQSNHCSKKDAYQTEVSNKCRDSKSHSFQRNECSNPGYCCDKNKTHYQKHNSQCRNNVQKQSQEEPSRSRLDLEVKTKTNLNYQPPNQTPTRLTTKTTVTTSPRLASFHEGPCKNTDNYKPIPPTPAKPTEIRQSVLRPSNRNIQVNPVKPMPRPMPNHPVESDSNSSDNPVGPSFAMKQPTPVRPSSLKKANANANANNINIGPNANNINIDIGDRINIGPNANNINIDIGGRNKFDAKPSKNVTFDVRPGRPFSPRPPPKSSKKREDSPESSESEPEPRRNNNSSQTDFIGLAAGSYLNEQFPSKTKFNGLVAGSYHQSNETDFSDYYSTVESNSRDPSPSDSAGYQRTTTDFSGLAVGSYLNSQYPSQSTFQGAALGSYNRTEIATVARDDNDESRDTIIQSDTSFNGLTLSTRPIHGSHVETPIQEFRGLAIGSYSHQQRSHDLDPSEVQPETHECPCVTSRPRSSSVDDAATRSQTMFKGIFLGSYRNQ
jgi:hypothetical protein